MLSGTYSFSMLVHDGFLYWSELTVDGPIRRCPESKCLGNEEVVVSHLNLPREIAVDAERLYLVAEDGTVGYVAL